MLLGVASAALLVLSMGIERLDRGALLGLAGLGFVLTGGILLREYRFKVKEPSSLRAPSF